MTDVPVPKARSNQRSYRLGAACAVVVLPHVAAQLVLARWPEPGLAQALPLAALIWSALIHALLIGLFHGRMRRNGPALMLFSCLALALLPGMPPLSGLLFAQSPAAAATEPFALVLTWISGLIISLLAQIFCRLIPLGLLPRPVLLSNPAALILTGLIFACGFCLALLLVPFVLQGGGSIGLAALTAVLLPGLSAALYALTALVLALLGLEQVLDTTAAKEGASPPPLILLALFGALAALSLLIALPDLSGLSWASRPVLLCAALLLLILLSLSFWRAPALLFTAGLALSAAAPAFAAAVLRPDLWLTGFCALLLAGILSVLMRGSTSVAAEMEHIGQAPAAVVSAYHSAARSWLVRLDLNERLVHFPRGVGPGLGYGEIASFGDLFSGAQFSGLIDLMQLISSDAKLPAGPVRLQLGQRLRNGESGSRLVNCEAWVIGNQPSEAWVALRSLEREQDLSARVTRYETLLGEAILREERLLSIAAHELRTPIAILSMLGEELKAGATWDEVGGGFDKTLERIVGILDDLRAGSGAEGGQAANRGFTLREVATQVVDFYTAAAVSNGLSLYYAAGDNSELLLHCDYNRVFIALSKLTHNAIIHSRGSEISLSAFVTRGAGYEAQVTWQVADDGIGIAASHKDRIFEPFETGEPGPEGRPGLGLYTARKAIRLMGGDLVLAPEGKGSRFILTHPVRVALAAGVKERKVITMNDVTPLYTGRRVLLVEDNKLVGEITSARLRKLFNIVDWAESGDAGLALFREHDYDMVVVDQLLPGLLGSELVREIRVSHKALPVIGITASTMGSECRALEEAGANYALEKPLSFGQLKSLAEEFFGLAVPVPASGSGVSH